MRRPSLRQALITLLPALAVLGIVVFVRLRYNVTTALMTGDIAGAAHLNPFVGFVSSLGILLWCTAMVSCFLGAAVLWHSSDRPFVRFMVASALLSGYLLFDDLFEVHDFVAPYVLGKSEMIVFVPLGIAVLAYLIVFWKTILKTDYTFLALAVALLALSAGMDNFVTDNMPKGSGAYMLEDGSKWLGIASWASYFARTAFTRMRAEMGLCSDRDASASENTPVAYVSRGGAA